MSKVKFKRGTGYPSSYEDGVIYVSDTVLATKLSDGTIVSTPMSSTPSSGSNNLDTYSWDYINSTTTLNVGDKKTITLADGTSVSVLVAGKSHDTLAHSSSGSAKAKYTFILTSPYGKAVMNDTHTNVGGWRDCKMRNVTMPANYDMLPRDLKEVIKPVKKQTTEGDTLTSLVTTIDKLFLLSETEMYGSTNHSGVAEGSQYSYFSNNSSDRFDDYGFWLRSPYSGSSGNFCLSSGGGVYDLGYANRSSPVLFGFCI